MWGAGLRAALCVGLGHFYLGRGKTAWALLGAMHLLAAATLVTWVYTAALRGPTVLLLVAMFALWSAQLGAAVRLARGGVAPAPAWPGRSLAFYVIAWVIGLAIARGVLRPLVIEGFEIRADSMAPTLLHGDHLWVAKWGERARAPRRGDVVAVAGDGDQLFVKRVVAVGGDTIESRDGWLVVNGEELAVDPCGDALYEYTGLDGVPRSAVCFVETAPGGPSYRVLRAPDLEAEDFAAVEVPADHLFVLGDNRDDSQDSRTFGPLPRARVIGRARVIWWSHQLGRVGAVD